MLRKEGYRKIKSIIRGAATGTAADVSGIVGDDIDVVCLTGNLWINPLITAAAASAIPLAASQSIALCVENGKTLSVISDGSGATYMIIVWGE